MIGHLVYVQHCVVTFMNLFYAKKIDEKVKPFAHLHKPALHLNAILVLVPGAPELVVMLLHVLRLRLLQRARGFVLWMLGRVEIELPRLDRRLTCRRRDKSRFATACRTCGVRSYQNPTKTY